MVGASTRQLIVTKPARSIAAASATVVVQAIISNSGEHATRSFRKFFATTIRNKNTRAAYLHAVSRFFAWCDPRPVESPTSSPCTSRPTSRPGKDSEADRQAASRRDPHVVRLAGHRPDRRDQSSPRGPRPKDVVKTGKTTVLTGEQARGLLDSIDVSSSSACATGR